MVAHLLYHECSRKIHNFDTLKAEKKCHTYPLTNTLLTVLFRKNKFGQWFHRGISKVRLELYLGQASFCYREFSTSLKVCKIQITLRYKNEFLRCFVSFCQFFQQNYIKIYQVISGKCHICHLEGVFVKLPVTAFDFC